MAIAGRNEMKKKTFFRRAVTNSLSNRWVRTNLLVTSLLLLTVEALLMLYTVSGSYQTVRQTLRSELTLIGGRFETVSTAGSGEKTALLHTLVQETAADADAVYTLQLLNENGDLYATSDGLLPGQADAAALRQNVDAELLMATAAADGIGESMARSPKGKNQMAVLWLVPQPVPGIGAVRLVTSLEGLNDRIMTVFFLSGAAVLLCFSLILFTGMYFVRSIVRPLKQVETSATKIAQGEFDIRLKKRHNDEIGRLCETINHMAEELSKTEQLKNEFISSVSHELRTPLTSIKGWTETLQRIDDVKDENYIHGMRIISGETDRLYGMVEELLDFSRMQSRGLQLHCEPLDLAAEVSDILLMAQQRITQAGLRLDYDEPAEVLAVSADPDRLKQVLINVLDNAVKYSPAGGSITVTVTGTEDSCRITVADQGQGIAPDELELVKTKFYKGRGAVRGSGIGLAVTDEIMQAHGGTLQLQSTVGSGTTVLLTLPRMG